jgi:hypothetical protein
MLALWPWSNDASMQHLAYETTCFAALHAPCDMPCMTMLYHAGDTTVWLHSAGPR